MKKLVLIITLLIAVIASSVFANPININRIDARVDYDDAYTYRLENIQRKDSASVSVTNNSRIDIDVLPGSNVTLSIWFENGLSRGAQKLRDVFSTVTLEGIENGNDLEKESADFEMDPGDEQRVDLEFKIPIDVESGNYKTVVKVEGKDRNDTSYGNRVNLKLEVKKQSHDIRISKINLDPMALDCSIKAKLTAQITNAGSNVEDSVAIEFKSNDLSLLSKDEGIALQPSSDASDEKSFYTKSVNFQIPPSLKPGIYQILVNIYWRGFVLFDQKKVELKVIGCTKTANISNSNVNFDGNINSETGENQVKIIQPQDGKFSKTDAILTTQEPSSEYSTIILLLFFGLVLLSFIGIIVFLIFFRERKNIML